MKSMGVAIIIVDVVSRRRVYLVGGIYGCGYQNVCVVRMTLYRCVSGCCCKEVPYSGAYPEF